MSNMGYCRFKNTSIDLRDCLEALSEIGSLDELSDSEKVYAVKLIEMCGEIISDFEYYIE